MERLEKAMKILILKTSSLGDIVHVFPTLSYLKKKFPHSQIDWIVEDQFATLLESHPEIHAIYRVHTKAWRKGRLLKKLWEFRKQVQSQKYDFLFDFQGNVKSGLLSYLVCAKQKAWIRSN